MQEINDNASAALTPSGEGVNLQDIKKQFFVFRNGVIADVLRRAGMPYKVIFGLQIPQIADIARTLEPSTTLADALWADLEVRESRILACYLFPPTEVSEEKARALLSSVRTPEERDMLFFRLFRHLPYALRAND